MATPPTAPSPDSKKRLALAIIDFLSKSLQDGTISSEDKDSIEVAQSCIAEAFHVDPSDQKAMKEAIGDQSLASIYGVYDKLKPKATASTSGASSAKEARPSTPTTASSSTTPNPEAEAFKNQGNAAMKQQNYQAAIDSYTKAINLCPTNAIYLSNRAAAYSAADQHLQASTDAEMAVAADPKYVKGWSRLGVARLALDDPKGSVEAYQKGIEYEGSGGGEMMKKALATAKQRLEAKEKEEADNHSSEIDDEGAREGGAGAAAGGMPDLASLAGMLGGGGGMPDLSSIMSNPMFASMAQNVMSNPDAMRNLMNNPQLRNLASQFGGGGGGGAGGAREGGAGSGGAGAGGGGGMPDLAAMMNDPAIAEMARNFMGGGQGGRGGAGR